MLKDKNKMIISLTDQNGREVDSRIIYNNRVNTGGNAVLDNIFGGTAAVFNVLALSTSVAANVATDTAASFNTAGQITSSGMAAKAATYTRTTAQSALDGQATCTMVATFTNSSAASVTIGKIGLTTSTTAGSGTLGFEALLGSALAVPVNYNVTITYTLNE